MLLAGNLRARVRLFAALRTRAELEQQSARLVREPSSETRTRAQAREFARCTRSELRAGFTSARFPRPSGAVLARRCGRKQRGEGKTI